LAKFATTAKAGPDREVDPAAIRCRTGLISNLCGVFGLAVIFMLDVSLQRADAGESKPLRWLFATRGALAMASDADISGLLDGAQPFVISGRPLSDIPAGWQAVPLSSFKSFDEIRNALETNALGPDARGVMYDYEKWRFTPAEEQQNPATTRNRNRPPRDHSLDLPPRDGQPTMARGGRQRTKKRAIR